MADLIDVHAHCVPLSALVAVRDSPGLGGVWWEPFEGVPQIRIGKRVVRPLFDSMVRPPERTGSDGGRHVSEVLSVWPDLLAYDLPAALAHEWHQAIDRGLAELAGSENGWLASLSAQDPELAAVELRDAVARGACGGLLGSNVNRSGLDARDLDALWTAACELDRPIFVHPVQPATDDRAATYNLRALTCYLGETTLALSALILSGVLDRFPALNLVVAHGGGTLPYQIGRLDKGYRLLASHSRASAEEPSAYLPRLYYDTITHSAPAFEFLLGQVGAERLMLGTDHPFGIGADIESQLAHINQLPASTAKAIVHDNASRLFGIG